MKDIIPIILLVSEAVFAVIACLEATSPTTKQGSVLALLIAIYARLLRKE